jgi:hypothetical protein
MLRLRGGGPATSPLPALEGAFTLRRTQTRRAWGQAKEPLRSASRLRTHGLPTHKKASFKRKASRQPRRVRRSLRRLTGASHTLGQRNSTDNRFSKPGPKRLVAYTCGLHKSSALCRPSSSSSSFSCWRSPTARRFWQGNCQDDFFPTRSTLGRYLLTGDPSLDPPKRYAAYSPP